MSAKGPRCEGVTHVTVRCPQCGRPIEVPQGLGPRESFECPECAGVWLRVRPAGQGLVATVVHRVSCPGCDRMLEVPEGARPGERMTCCGQVWRLTFAYGAWALER